ncbi:MAG TPA: tail fiber protein [Bacteroidales bacterium]|nr:tail fiber protein [Bacteroidales bacterium]
MDELLGRIQLFPYGYAPRGWILCQGQSLIIQQNTALYSLLGNQFGGDGRTTYGIPNLQGASPVSGMEYYICTAGVYPTRE